MMLLLNVDCYARRYALTGAPVSARLPLLCVGNFHLELRASNKKSSIGYAPRAGQQAAPI